MYILILFILNISYKYAESVPKYSDEVNQTLFGNLASVQDLLMTAKYTLEWNGTKNANDFDFLDTNINIKNKFNFMEPDDFEVDHGSQDHADQMYNKLSKEVKVMRRELSFDREDTDDNDLGIFDVEREKRAVIRGCFLQFIIHTRYEVGKALRLREPIRYDRRYQIGYLFNRLRRIKTEQLKLLYYLQDRMRHRSRPWGHGFQYYHTFFVEDPFLNHLMIYEKLTAFDVDIKDTINYIKEIYAKKAVYDYVEDEGVKTTAPTLPPKITAPPDATTIDQAKQLATSPKVPYGGIVGPGMLAA